MTTTRRRATAAPKETIPLNFHWNDATKSIPDTFDVPHHGIFKISTILLIHDEKQGNLPGYYIRYNEPYVNSSTGAEFKKGQGFYYAMSGEVLNDVTYFYPVNKIPVTVGDK